MSRVTFLVVTLCAAFTSWPGSRCDIRLKDLLTDISLGKRVIIKSMDANSKDLEFTNPTLHCISIHKDSEIVVNLLENFPVYQVRVSLRFPADEVNVMTYVNKSLCRLNDTLSYRAFKVFFFNCNLFSVGRSVHIFFNSTVVFCRVQVFTCIAGKRNSICTKDCDDGTYGISCTRNCSCKNDYEVCDKQTGMCKSGCKQYFFKTKDCFVASAAESIQSTIASLQDAHMDIRSHPPFLTAVRKAASDSTTNDSSWLEGGDHLMECLTLKLEEANTKAWLEVVFSKIETIFAIKFYLACSTPRFVTVSITVDEKLCINSLVYVLSEEDKEKTFQCSPGPLLGRTVRITVYGNFLSQTKLSFCNLMRVVCAPDVYGKQCDVTCNCQFGDCDQATGHCTRQCRPGFRGQMCAVQNLLENHIEETANFVGGLKPDENSETRRSFPSSYLDPSINRWVSWIAVQLDSIYHVTDVAVNYNKQKQNQFSNVEVYLDPTPWVSETLFPSSKKLNLSNHQGQLCIPQLGPTTKRVAPMAMSTCNSFTRTVFVILSGTHPFYKPVKLQLKVWSCSDGTFGPECKFLCNCQSVTDICQKDTGYCPSGCATGYTGIDCQDLCTLGSNSPDCPDTSNCNCVELAECFHKPRVCPSGCDIGYFGPGCYSECHPERPHTQCRLPCGTCGSGEFCNHIKGQCIDLSQLARQKTGYLTVTDFPLKNKNFLIGVVIALGTISVVLIAYCIQRCMVYQRRARHHLRRSLNTETNRRITKGMNEEILRRERQKKEESLKKQFVLDDGEDPVDELEWRKNKKAKREMKEMNQFNVPPPAPQFPGTDHLGRCAPLKDNTQQAGSHKVAEWILSQDFNVLIDRRKTRLSTYIGSQLSIEESVYDIELIPISTTDIHELYDEAGKLQLP